jgi:hypothetical protein
MKGACPFSRDWRHRPPSTSASSSVPNFMSQLDTLHRTTNKIKVSWLKVAWRSTHTPTAARGVCQFLAGVLIL